MTTAEVVMNTPVNRNEVKATESRPCGSTEGQSIDFSSVSLRSMLVS